MPRVLFPSLPRSYRENDLVLLDVKINAEMVEPLAAIVHRDNAYYVRRVCCSRPASAVLACRLECLICALNVHVL